VNGLLFLRTCIHFRHLLFMKVWRDFIHPCHSSLEEFSTFLAYGLHYS
jgi:hypothetical protein